MKNCMTVFFVGLLFSLKAFSGTKQDPFCQKKALAVALHRYVGEKFDLFGHQYDGDNDGKSIVTAYELNQSNHDERNFVIGLGWPEKNGVLSADADGRNDVQVIMQDIDKCEHAQVPTTALLAASGGCRSAATRSALYHAVLGMSGEPSSIGQVISQSTQQKNNKGSWTVLVTIIKGSYGDSGSFVRESAQTSSYSIVTALKGKACSTTQTNPL